MHHDVEELGHVGLQHERSHARAPDALRVDHPVGTAAPELLHAVVDPERDVRFSMGPIDVLDHSSRAFTYGSKMGIDATRKWPEEGFTRNWPKVIEMDAETKRRVDEMWSKLGLGADSGSQRFNTNAPR